MGRKVTEDKDMYRQSCDLPDAARRITMATPHVPYTRRRDDQGLPPAPVEKVVHARRKTDKPPVEITPARVQRTFHMRIAITGAVGLSYLLFTLLK